jgi:hypothetical protein
MEQAARGVDEEHFMGTTRAVWMVYSDGTEEDLVAHGDSQKLHNLLDFSGERLSELIKIK